jgi:hypothetical protein
MNALLAFVLRAAVVAAGVLLAAGLMVTAAFLLGIWLLRAGWARLTGRTVRPFTARIRPGFTWAGMRPRAASAAPQPAYARARHPADVTDVQAK